MSKNLFITGTGTDIGKTYVTGLILKKFQENKKNAAYYKAAMSGNKRHKDGNCIPGDALYVKTISKIAQPLEQMCPYVYEAAVSPHLAAQMEGNPIDMQHVLQRFDCLSKQFDYITIEGSGGIICPLRYDTQHIQLEDFIKARNFNCLLVADAGLGTINSVVLTVEYMKAHDIVVKGIIFNHYQPDQRLHNDNIQMCESMTKLKILACVQTGDTNLNISFKQLEALYQ